MENTKKQTVVEWFAKELKNLIRQSELTDMKPSFFDEKEAEILEHAKEMEKGEQIDFGKRCFYKGFEKAESDDANCFTAWREEVQELLTFKSE